MNLPFLCLAGLCAVVTCLHAIVLLDMRNASRPSRDMVTMAVSADFSAIATATFFVLAVLT